MEKPQATDKQREFVRLITEERQSYADAYRGAYDAEGSKGETVRREAHRLTRNPNVAPLLDAARVEEARSIQRNLGLRRRWIVERLVGEAEDGDSPPASRVRALELLARQAGLFDSTEERADKRQSASEEELTAELESRLAALLPEAGSIDVTPDSVGSLRDSQEGNEMDPSPR